MSIFQGLPDRLSKICSAARNANALLGPKVAALGLVYHCTHLLDARYHRTFEDALWNKVMKTIPFDESAIAHLDSRNEGPIWVAWWQGIDAATPPTILACIDSIRRHADGREVIIITRENYAQYADIDPVLIRRREAGTLTISAFCDALRVKLLYEHGGVWLDSTLYLTQDLSEDFARYPFYSIHAESPECRWTAYCLASVRGNPLMDYLYRCFVKVFSNIEAVPEYFLIDELFLNAYRHIPTVTRMIDAIPVSNNGRFELSEQMASTAECPQIAPGTYIHKLTYKIKYPTSVDGRSTLFQRVLDGAL